MDNNWYGYLVYFLNYYTKWLIFFGLMDYANQVFMDMMFLRCDEYHGHCYYCTHGNWNLDCRDKACLVSTGFGFGFGFKVLQPPTINPNQITIHITFFNSISTQNRVEHQKEKCHQSQIYPVDFLKPFSPCHDIT